MSQIGLLLERIPAACMEVAGKPLLECYANVVSVESLLTKLQPVMITKPQENWAGAKQWISSQTS